MGSARNTPSKPTFKVMKMAPLLNNFQKPGGGVKKLCLIDMFKKPKDLQKIEEASDQEANADISLESMNLSEDKSSLGDGQKSDPGVDSSSLSEKSIKSPTMEMLRQSPIAELVPRPDKLLKSGRIVILKTKTSSNRCDSNLEQTVPRIPVLP